MIKLSSLSSLRGELTVPGDKSISHRSVMLGAIAEGDTTIHGFLSSEDCLATIDCFRKMGVSIEEACVPAERADGEERMETVLTVHGNGLCSLKDPGVTLNAMNSGTTVRLMSGILAGQSLVSQITGDDSLRSRPMGRIIKPLGLMGVMCATAAGSEKLPITIFGGQVQPVRYESPIASAQVKSVPISALIASTVRSSTIALTCAIREPTSVRMRVMTTSQRYGFTNGRMFLKRPMRFICYCSF